MDKRAPATTGLACSPAANTYFLFAFIAKQLYYSAICNSAFDIIKGW